MVGPNDKLVGRAIVIFKRNIKQDGKAKEYKCHASEARHNGQSSVMSSRTWSQRVHTGVEGAAPQRFPLTLKEGDKEINERNTSVCDGEGSFALQVKVGIPKPIAEGISPEQKTGSSRWTHWRRKSGGKLEGIQSARWVDRIIFLWLGLRYVTRESSNRTARSRSTKDSLRKLTITGNLPPNIVIARMESTRAHRC